MITINKTEEPESLIQDKRDGAKVYPDDLRPGTGLELREKLLNDQGFLCCYCQRRIPEKKIPKSKIEHFECQDDNPDKQLLFSNLFIACSGNEKDKKKENTCDTLKSNSTMTSFELLKSRIEDNILYTKNGVIFSEDENIERELNEVLNLNEENLRKNREGIFHLILRNKKAFNKKGQYDKIIIDYIKYWSDRNSKKQFNEFVGFALYFLNKKKK
jgi:uncharacterized protein (TIGR02646 family)